MRFASPWYLLLLLGILALAFWVWKRRDHAVVRFSGVSELRALKDVWGERLIWCAKWLRILTLVAMVVTLARPQRVNVEQELATDGVDIMMAIDVSHSMAAEDFKPENRIAVAREKAKLFIEDRPSDRIGLVVFGGEAFTQCPLTLDHHVLLQFVDQVKLDMVGDGTAIGMALATGLNRLKDSKAKTKLMILLTDGDNNAGDIDPRNAAELAATLGVKVYTIGVGKEGGAPIPIQHPTLGKVYARNPDGTLYLTQIDEGLLRDIAQTTHGAYFRATDSKALEGIYKTINKLEKTEMKSKAHYKTYDYFGTLLGLCLALLLVEFGIQFWVRRLP